MFGRCPEASREKALQDLKGRAMCVSMEEASSVPLEFWWHDFKQNV